MVLEALQCSPEPLVVFCQGCGVNQDDVANIDDFFQLGECFLDGVLKHFSGGGYPKVEPFVATQSQVGREGGYVAALGVKHELVVSCVEV